MADTYDTTFYFYYDECIDGCKDFAMMKQEFKDHKLDFNYAYDSDNKKFWVIKLVMKGLTARDVKISDIAMKLKFKFYDGWDIDTRDPSKTLEDFGYIPK